MISFVAITGAMTRFIHFFAKLLFGLALNFVGVALTFKPKSVQSVDVVFRKGSLWIGAHYSPYARRWCINIIPCVTIRVVLEGGKLP